MPADARVLVKLIRWQNAIIAAAAVFVGAWWCAHDLTRPATALAAAAALFLTAYANAFNDLVDVEIDRVAHPRRPLPSGALRPRQVRDVAIAAAIAGTVLAWQARSSLGWLTLAVLALMTLYSVALAALPLVGNLVVALVASLPFFYGAVTVGALRPGLALVGVAMPLHFARELAKSLDDAAADAPHRRTAPLVLGKVATRLLILAALGLFAWRAFVLVGPEQRLRSVFVPAITLAAIACTRSLAGRAGAPLLFKTAMLAAMAALVVAR